MYLVNESGVEKRRDNLAAAFDHEALDAAFVEFTDESVQVDTSVRRRRLDNRRALAERVDAVVRGFVGDGDDRRGFVVKNRGVVGYTRRRVEDDARRISAFSASVIVLNGERRVVGGHRTDADEYRVAFGAEAVYTFEVLGARQGDLRAGPVGKLAVGAGRGVDEDVHGSDTAADDKTVADGGGSSSGKASGSGKAYYARGRRKRMFRSEINAGLLKSSVDTVSVLVDECKVRLDEDGLSIKAVDPANVGMVELDIPAESFESYEADDELLGLNLVRFEDIVGMANKGDIVEMELDEETRKLTIRIDGLRYTLSLIDPDSIHQEPNVPDLDLPGDVELAGRELRRGVKAAGMVSDHMAFGVSDDETFYMRAEGDTDDVRVDLGEDDVISLDTGGENAESLFSLDYLDSMAKAIPNDAAVAVEVGDDYPVKMNFDVAGGDSHVTYLLAPRIENE